MDAAAFTAFDWGVIGIIALSTIMAFFRGFTTVALSLAAWVGALIVSSLGFKLLQPYARDLVGEPALADILSLATLFLTSLILFKFIASRFGSAVRDSAIGFLDRSLGALFGLLRGLVIVSVIFIGIKTLSGKELPDWVETARAKPLANWGAFMVESMASEALGRMDEEDSTVDRLKKVGEGALEAGKREATAIYEAKARQQLDALVDDVEKEADAIRQKQKKKKDDDSDRV